MTTGMILILAFLTYIVAVDRNVGDFLYLKLFKAPILLLKIRAYQLRIFIGIRYDIFMMNRGIIRKKYLDMASEILQK